RFRGACGNAGRLHDRARTGPRCGPDRGGGDGIARGRRRLCRARETRIRPGTSMMPATGARARIAEVQRPRLDVADRAPGRADSALRHLIGAGDAVAALVALTLAVTISGRGQVTGS